MTYILEIVKIPTENIDNKPALLSEAYFENKKVVSTYTFDTKGNQPTKRRLSQYTFLIEPFPG